MRIFLGVFLAVVLAGCDAIDKSRPAKVSEDLETARLAAQKAQLELQTKQLDRAIKADEQLWQLRQMVAQACADRGKIPTIHDGNVDCK